MKNIINIARMELQKMFYSPIAWLVLIIFAVQSSIQFMGIVSQWIMNFEMGYGTDAVTTQVYAGMFGFFTRIQDTVYLYIPLITMGLMSKEFGSGSIKLLYSSPISNAQIVLGKYLAALFFCAAMTSVMLIESLYGFVVIKEVDFAQVLTGLLGMFLVIATYSAIGLFMSSITSYQIVAAIATFATLFVLNGVGDLWQTIDFVRDITYWLSVSGKSQSFIQGIISSEDFLYFFLVSGLFIMFTVYRLKGIREKSSGFVSVTRYAGTFLIIALIGYITTIPALKKYHDSTRTNLNTLTEKSQEVMAKLKGKVKITTYVNVIGRNFWSGSPRGQKRDMGTYENYQRFYPNIAFEYKYYYAIPVQEEFAKSHHKRYAGLTDKEALDKVLNLYEMDSEEVKPAEAYMDEINLKEHLNRFVRKIENENGTLVYQHLYDDNQVFPSESQITASFKKLMGGLPKVGFVERHGERDVDNMGSRGYYSIVQEKPFRWSLWNNGIEYTKLNLMKPVGHDIDILVIAGSKIPFNETEMNNLNGYINRGGNLVIAADRKRQETMNPLVEQFGVRFEPGQVVEYNKGYTMDLVAADVTKEGQKLAYQFDENIVKRDGCVTMPGAVAVTFKRKFGFNYIPVLVSDSIKSLPKLDDANLLSEFKKSYATEGKQLTKEEAERDRMLAYYSNENEKPEDKGKYFASWNELETSDFIDDVALYNPEKGELGGALTTALAVTRKIGEKEQKIMILGDADCFSNGEITRSRKGIQASNFAFVNGMFFWLTNEESPTDVRRPHNPDDAMLVKKDDLSFANILYKFIVPSLLALTLLLIWLRRRGR